MDPSETIRTGIHYLLHPLDRRLSPKEKLTALTASVALGVFTLGTFHCFFCSLSKCTDRNATTEEERRLLEAEVFSVNCFSSEPILPETNPYVASLNHYKTEKIISDILTEHLPLVDVARNSLIEITKGCDTRFKVVPEEKMVITTPEVLVALSMAYNLAGFSGDLEKNYKNQLFMNILVGKDWLFQNTIPTGYYQVQLTGNYSFFKPFFGYSKEASQFFTVGHTLDSLESLAKKSISSPLKDMKQRGVFDDFILEEYLQDRFIQELAIRFKYKVTLFLKEKDVARFDATIEVVKEVGNPPFVKVTLFENFLFNFDVEEKSFRHLVYEISGKEPPLTLVL